MARRQCSKFPINGLRVHTRDGLLSAILRSASLDGRDVPTAVVWTAAGADRPLDEVNHGARDLVVKRTRNAPRAKVVKTSSEKKRIDTCRRKTLYALYICAVDTERLDFVDRLWASPDMMTRQDQQLLRRHSMKRTSVFCRIFYRLRIQCSLHLAV